MPITDMLDAVSLSISCGFLALVINNATIIYNLGGMRRGIRDIGDELGNTNDRLARINQSLCMSRTTDAPNTSAVAVEEGSPASDQSAEQTDQSPPATEAP